MKDYVHAGSVQIYAEENEQHIWEEEHVSFSVCVWSSIFLIRHRVAGINLTNTSMQSWGIYTQSNTHKRTDMPVSHCNSTCSHVQTSINKLTLTHPHIEQIHTVVSMNMRRVTSVLIVNNDCSHGPSPCCCDAVPLSIIVAAPSITLHSHSHCWTLHTQTHNTDYVNTCTLKVLWKHPVDLLLFPYSDHPVGLTTMCLTVIAKRKSMTFGSKETTFQITTQ